MIQALVITLREGMEAALVIGIVLAYLGKLGRGELKRAVWSGLAVAVAASIVTAVLLERLKINQEAFEGWVMLAAAVFVSTMVVWMWRTARRLKGRIEEKVGGFAVRGAGAAWLGIFLFVTLMVLREGVETVLMLGAISFSTEGLLELSGAATGLALAVAFGAAFFKGSLRINLGKFFRVTSLMLFVIVAQLLITGVHELSEAMVLPSSKREMALIGPIVQNDVFFFVIILTVALALVGAEWMKRRSVPVAGEELTAAEKRKRLWEQKKERWWTAAAGIVALLIMVTITAEFLYARSAQALSPAHPVNPVEGVIRIPLNAVNDGNLHRFGLSFQGTTIRFLALKRPNGDIVTALDACLICGDVGYYQKGRDIICKNCVAAINPATIGMPGGCNPIALASRVEGPEVVISVAELQTGLKHFKH